VQDVYWFIFLSSWNIVILGPLKNYTFIYFALFCFSLNWYSYFNVLYVLVYAWRLYSTDCHSWIFISIRWHYYRTCSVS
jgi:hypothetical protein